MNEQERSDLEWLKRRQTRLLEEVQTLSKQIEAVEQRLERSSLAQPPPLPETTSLTSPPPIPIPPPPSSPEAPRGQPEPALPPPVPPIIAPAPVFAQAEPPEIPDGPDIPPAPSVEPQAEEPTPAPMPSEVPPLEPAMAQSAPPKAAEATSFEMRLGTYWLVRIGIVMLVTGLVFFGNLAYHNIISKLGPGGKISLLYLASATLLGAGAWWQRKPVKESLKNYAQVLFAGGLASVYFTTFAAHHVERLQIIKSAALDGALLLIWAGFIVWIADRKKSQVLALFALLLAYYSLFITHVEVFTLYSTLVLTLAAVFFLVRNRWATLTFVSLGATYAAYGYWRFSNGQDWHWVSPEDGLWRGVWFLIGYWIIFTAGIFLSRDKQFTGPNRASFLTANNGAFFAMFLLTMWQVHHGGFWKFALIYGSTLLGLAAAARQLLPAEPLAKNSYLTQGLLLATVGIISHPNLAGLNLALMLATESVVLLATGQWRKNLVLLVGAYLTAALAIGWGMDGMMEHERHGMWLAIGLGFLMLINTLVAHRHLLRASGLAATRSDEPGRQDSKLQTPSSREIPNSKLQPPSPRPSPPGEGETQAGVGASSVLRPQPSYFMLLALAVWFVATWNNTARANFSFVLSIEAIVLILSIYVLRVPEISLLSQCYLGLAQIVWMYDAFNGVLTLPWWNPVLMLVLNLGLVRWWQSQQVLKYQPRGDLAWFIPENLATPGKNLVLVAATHIAVKLAGGWELDPVPGLGPPGLYLPISLGLLILFDAILYRQRVPVTLKPGLQIQAAYSTVLALLVGLAITWHHTTRQSFPLILACEAVALTASFYLLRVPEIALFGQGYLIFAQIAWISYFGFDTHHLPPWWNPIFLIAISLGLSHWWQKQKTLTLPASASLFWQGLYALAIVGVLYFWLNVEVEAPMWLALTTLLAVLLTAYGTITRSWLLAAFGQIFIVLSAIQFALQLAQGKPAWWFALAPMLGLGALAYSTVKWFERKADSDQQVRGPLLQAALVYRWAALVMSICWVAKYIPERERVWFFVLLGLVVFLLAGRRKSIEGLLWGAIYSGCGLAWLWIPGHETSIVYLPNFVAVVVILAQQQIAKTVAGRYTLTPQIHGGVITAGGLSLWYLVTRWIWDIADRDSKLVGLLTASWCVLALLLFATGILTRERVHRWLGLVVLACSVARVVFVDVWRIEPIYRVLSFMALGVVALVLGFIYNKYAEKIKQWL